MRRFSPHTILFLGLLLSPFQNIAQEYLTNITTVGVEDGLLGRNVLHIFEDSRDLIWIVTTKGVNCFDGENFKYFFEDKQQINPSCVEFVEDIHGNIWNCYFRKDNSSKYHYLIDKYFQLQVIDEYFAGKMPFKANEIDFIRQLEDNILYLTTTKGEIYRYDGSFSLVTAHSDYIDAKVSKKDKDNGLILITTKGLEFLSPSGIRERRIDFPFNEPDFFFRCSMYKEKIPFLKEGIYIKSKLDNCHSMGGYFAKRPELITKFDKSLAHQ